MILTKDNITVNIDTSVYYRIIDAKVAYYTLQNIMASVAEVTYATLRTFCGENTLQDLLEKRQEISDKIEEYVESKVNRWGNIYIYDRCFCRANIYQRYDDHCRPPDRFIHDIKN